MQNSPEALPPLFERLLERRVAVVLGASDRRSLGASAAAALARAGATVVVAARRTEMVEEVARSIGGMAVTCDIVQEDQVAGLAQKVQETFGGCDIAVNVVGVPRTVSISRLSREVLLELTEIHFFGTALFIKHMGPTMRRGGSIILTSSIATLMPVPGAAVYGGSKVAADYVMRVAALEYGAKGVTVNSIAPGMTATAMTADLLTDEVRLVFENQSPLGRLPTVEDFAETVVWLARAKAITGQVIDLSCGLQLRGMPAFRPPSQNSA